MRSRLQYVLLQNFAKRLRHHVVFASTPASFNDRNAPVGLSESFRASLNGFRFYELSFALRLNGRVSIDSTSACHDDVGAFISLAAT